MRVVKLAHVPSCDFCNRPAKYDAPMRSTGQWAYFCKEHKSLAELSPAASRIEEATFEDWTGKTPNDFATAEAEGFTGQKRALYDAAIGLGLEPAEALAHVEDFLSTQ